MKPPTHSPSWAAGYAEAQARASIERERAINRVIANRNPCLLETEQYRRGTLSSFDMRFNSRADYLRYVARREMGRFDQLIDYPTPERIA